MSVSVDPAKRRGLANPRSLGPSVPRSLSAFTLVELLVSIVIIVLILAAVVPSVESMWDQRKLSETETILRGAMLAARQRAAEGVESGLLFFVDAEGVQRVYSIERQDEPPAARTRYGVAPVNDAVRVDVLSANRFRISDGKALSLPPPIRVAPRYAVLADEPPRNDDPVRFSDEELANNDFLTDNGGAIGPTQRHRNFFSIVFSREGQLIVGRDVVVYDEDRESQQGGPGQNVGDATSLPVSRTESRFLSDDGNGGFKPLYPLPFAPAPTLVHLITVQRNNEAVAANFKSVDGVLVYDDELFGRTGPITERRPFLTDTGRPYYVGRVTGDIVRGPLAENKEPG